MMAAQSKAGSATALVVGTFDTKATELSYIAEFVREAGLACCLVDVSTSGQIDAAADVSCQVVAACHPQGADAVFSGDRGSSVAAMAQALKHYLLARHDLGGVIGAGGSGAAALLSPALQALPVGLPKVLVTTMANGDVSPYVGDSDIMLMYPVADVSGINSISSVVLANAASALVGMIQQAKRRAPLATRPAIGMTMFGVTTPCVQAVTRALEREFDCIVFHATGAGGRAMERLAASGLLAAVLDITTTEITDEVCGGVLSAGPQRLEAIAAAGVPYVGSLGAIDVVNFWSLPKVPAQHRARTLHKHNDQVTLMRADASECATIGSQLAAKLNRMQGPVRFLIPAGGFSALDAPGQPFWSPPANNALIDSLTAGFDASDQHQLRSVPLHINDPGFAQALIAALREVLPAPLHHT